MFNFVPQFALDFYAAVRARDHDTVYGALRDFVLPYIAIRDNQPGYGVSIVKAGLESIGRSAGPVRPPLTNLTIGEQAQLDALISGVTAGIPSARVAS
jgi:5-dehydro-4-deoxyglucarate dehydratase